MWLEFVRAQLQTVRQALALTRQLHYPTAGFAARRTAQVRVCGFGVLSQLPFCTTDHLLPL